MPFHGPELIVVLVVALLIFGPKKLPEMGSAIGKSIKEFKKGINEISHPKQNEVEAPKEALEETRLPISNKDMSKLGSTTYASEGAAVEKNNE
jgi:sec-independent protein translocase protein TatA